MAYRTKEQMEEETRFCKSLDIEDVAKYMGFSTYHKGNSAGYAFIRDREGLVLFKKTNTFKDFYNNTSGTVIDFVMKERGLSVKDTVSFLLDYAGVGRDQNSVTASTTVSNKSQHEAPEKEDRKIELVLPEKNTDYRRVYAYLTKSRHIDYEVVTHFVKADLLYEDRKHHNAVFIAKDKDGNPKHAFLRGTLTDPQKRFRGDVTGSDKQYGFTRVGSNDNNTLTVFEAPIDLMRFMSLTKDKNTHLLALGMLDTAPIYKYYEEHPEIEQITFILDNDKPGIEATERFSRELAENGFTVVENNFNKLIADNGVKDVNELLEKMRSKTVEPVEVKKQSI